MNGFDPMGLWPNVNIPGVGDVNLPSPSQVGHKLLDIGGRAVATLISTSPIAQVGQVASSVSGYTIGGCFGLTISFIASGTDAVCYYATPSGQSGLAVTQGSGAGTPSISASFGLVFSNGWRLKDQGGRFTYGETSAGAGPLASVGVSYAQGRNQVGCLIRDLGFNWTPNLPIVPGSLSVGQSNTWTFQAWSP